MSYYTCNGSPKGCERERFGMCAYHDSEFRYSVTFELDGQTLNRTVDANGPAQAVESVLWLSEHAKILSVVDITETKPRGNQ